MHFENLNLHPSVMKGVHELGYQELTPIQNKAIPPILNGKDIIGLAQTGTGKTAAFTLPLLQHLIDLPRRQINAAIITPTRELSEQIGSTVSNLGKYTDIKTTTLYGGTNINNQIRELNRGVEIVVACPGRLIDHLWRGTVDMSNLEILIIDEADRMLDMGFLPDIRKIIQCLLKPRQTLLFSATMPASIKKLAREILRDPLTVQIGHTAPATTVSHYLYPVRQHLKTSLLTELLYRIDSKSVLVFTRTKHRAERITRHLRDSGFKSASLQGNLSQSRRDAAINGFRAGSIKILVATDIAARGLDIRSISHVINYDMPENTDAYIHRIGRTGRVNHNGDALTFITSEDRGMVDSIERILNSKIERRMLDSFDYDQHKGKKPGLRKSRRIPSNHKTPHPMLAK
ncbi:MAG: DEAD/DEAH box helicase [Dehalococcoidales bacterium]|nr:MAG: DEAD/DEAH box helicase [Dehalococcoidales bacterium]